MSYNHHLVISNFVINGRDSTVTDMWNLFYLTQLIFHYEACFPLEQNYGHQLLIQCNLVITQSQSAKDTRFVCRIFCTLLIKFDEERKPRPGQRKHIRNMWECRGHCTACTQQKVMSDFEHSCWHGMNVMRWEQELASIWTFTQQK